MAAMAAEEERGTRILAALTAISRPKGLIFPVLASRDSGTGTSVESQMLLAFIPVQRSSQRLAWQLQVLPHDFSTCCHPPQ